jgi:phage shock protein PspC (stress-responsive transcriptional regulator)
MKKTIQVHIGGMQFHIDEDAYKVLQQYLDALKAHFEKDGEEGKEIITDIEQRIAELLGKKISESRQVITLPDVDEIIKTLGTIEDFKYGEEEAHEEAFHERRANRRFYRDTENYYLGGVAAGLGAYFNIDPLWIRLIFIALIFLKGAGLVIYAILWLVVPKAVSTSQKLEMKGKPVNVSTIEKSIAEEYSKVKTSFSTWSQSEKTRNAVDSVFKTFATIIMGIFKIILYALGIVFLITGSIFLAFLIVLFFGNVDFFTAHGFMHGWFIPDLSGWMSNHANYKLLALSLFLLVFIPFVSLIYTGIKIIFHIRTKSVVLRATAFTAWILALVLFLTLLFSEMSSFSVEAMGADSQSVSITENTTFLIDVKENISKKNTVSYSIFDYDLLYNKRHETIYGKVCLVVLPEFDDHEITVNIKRYLRNVSMDNADEYLDEVRYHYALHDSAVILDKYFEMDGDDFWRFGKVVVEISVPVNTRVRFPSELCEMLNTSNTEVDCYDNAFSGRYWIMTRDGLKAPEQSKNSR